MSASEIAWVAGVLEGEGSFITGANLVISVTMTDQDVIERLASLTGVGRIHVNGSPKRDHYKPAYQWHVKRIAHVRQLALAVMPWLGERRAAAATRLLNALPQQGSNL